MSLVWTILAFVVVVAGLAYRLRIRQELDDAGSGLSNGEIRAIERTGSLRVDDEPLDLDEIERAEEEFWEESWDEPEEW